MSLLDEECRRLRANDPTLTALEYVSARGLMRGGLQLWGWDGFALQAASEWGVGGVCVDSFLGRCVCVCMCVRLIGSGVTLFFIFHQSRTTARHVL